VQDYYKFILYIPYLTEFVKSSVAVQFKAVIRAKSMYIIKSLLTTTRNMVIKKNLYINIHLRDGLEMEVAAC